MSANAEARWAQKAYEAGEITADELDDAERDARYEADRDAWEYECESDNEDDWMD